MAAPAPPPPPAVDVIGPVAFQSITVDKWGAVMMGASVGIVLLLWCYFRWCKWRAGVGRMDSVLAGQLRLAAARGRVEDLELLSTLPGFAVDADLLGFTPLHAAAVQGHAAATLWLLQHGADITKCKEDGWKDTILHYAAGSGSLGCAQVLVAHGADPSQANALGNLPADIATRASHGKLARYLRGVADGSISRPTVDQAIKHFGSSSAPHNGVSNGNGHANGQANGKANGKADSSSDEELGKESPRTANGAASAGKKPAKKTISAAAKELVKRGFEGYGTQGTVPKRETKFFRPMAILTQVLGGIYLAWRALRTLRPGYGYFYSVPFWLAEFLAYCLSYCFVASLFYMIERPEKRMEEMMSEDEFPSIDVYICTYSEPVEIVEPTCVAALNMNWPGSKLNINILDDGKRPEMARLVRRLAFQCKYMQREANITYIGRDKAKGVPHHAKAGNINSCLLKEGKGRGEFILVLDCDMIVEPDFLQKTVGHFYVQEEEGVEAPWVPKKKAAFIQTPQDFFNVDAADPMVHCARFFYGPMLQGRDGIGACPCCGTGVVFRRDVLVSIGGQAYGSITEDYNTAMTLMSAGMATMYLNERLVYGMAPDEIADVMTQRLRWAMGALQILMKDNPLRLVGLTNVQSLLFFEAAAHHYLAITTVFMAVVPIIYLFTQVSPMICAHLWEFTLVFGSWYLSNRCMMWYVHRGTEGGSQELWRGSQMWVWMAPNHLKAIWKVLVAENAIVKRLFNFEIGFTVTSKEKAEESRWAALKKAFTVTWPHLLYYLAFFAGIVYFIVTAALNYYTTWQIMVFLSAIAWGTLIVLCIFPPIWTMIPRVETEQGWKIVWDPFADPASFGRTHSSMGRLASISRSPDHAPERSGMLSGLWSTMSLNLGSGKRRRSLSRDIGRPSLELRRPSRDGRGSRDGGRSIDLPAGRTSLANRSVMLSAMPETIQEDGEAEDAATKQPAAGPRANVLPVWNRATGPGSAAGRLAGAAPAPIVHSVSFASHASKAQLSKAQSIFASMSSGGTTDAAVPSPFAPTASVASPFGPGATDPSPFAPAATAASPFAPAPTPSPFAPAAGACPGGSQMQPSQRSGDGPSQVAIDVALSAQLSDYDGRRDGAFSNIGRVAMRRRTAAVLERSALLTSLVLPERIPGQRGMSVLLDSEGHAAPGSSAPLAAEQSVQLSAAFTSGGAPGNLSGLASDEMTSVSLPIEQSMALGRLTELTGADVSVVLPPLVRGSGPNDSMANVSLAAGQLPTISAVDAVRPYLVAQASSMAAGAARDPSSPTSGNGSYLSPRAAAQSAAAGPGSPPSHPIEPEGGLGRISETSSLALSGANLSGALSTGVKPSAAAQGVQRSPQASGLSQQQAAAKSAGSSLFTEATPEEDAAEAAEAAAEAALADELAAEEFHDMPVSTRVAAISQQLVQIASALSPANASMLLDGGGSMVVPVLPQSIFEHTLVARPNFKLKQSPSTSYMFLIVNLSLLCALIAGSVLEYFYNPAASVSAAGGVAGFG